MTTHWYFATWSFDAQSHVLETDQFSATLEPKVARLLQFLLEHNGSVLSRDELVAAVWDGRAISDEAVRRAVCQLRQVLAHDGSERYLKTVRKQGYLPQFPIASSAAPAPRRRWLLIVGLCASFALALLFAIVWLFSHYRAESFW
ncbi:winged helix-turn-helix domain-containing protein [Parahaliea sp. F7430]|uniref:Winged helix-turn-helix domain-containing protein n=1 Tax=Sediminihaliea albiluteola TaxID=2758564 RepID=A0A7W2TWC8_9GAMM|nr:winged helix-turn-helix domain-containing protein [Sediminihaliea albiluteola]MBA6413176.1 winged helix-turn-helix domain-containing protein [Sediminihaliea albiluteola]